MEEKIRALVVDDVYQNRFILKMILEKEGLSVIEACDGREALEIIDKETVDIALLDIMMPDIDGLEVCRRLRERFTYTELPILFITAKVEDQDLAEGFRVGGNDYITKPINSTILLARLRTQINMLQASRAFARSQEKLANQKRMETVALFAAGIAHNFNNLLGTVMGSSELIKLCAEDDSDIQKSADLILAASRRGAELTNSLLTFTRRNSTEFCPNPQEVVRATSPLVDTISQGQVNYVIDVKGEIPPLCIAQSDLAQLLLELLKNSVEAIGRDGTIEVTVEETEQQEGSADGTGVNVPMVTFTIKDTGCGIPEDKIAHAFEPFVSTKNLDSKVDIALDGKGLGLSTAYNIVQQAKGAIDILATSSEGTTMSFCIPVMNELITDNTLTDDTLTDDPIRA